MRSLTGVFSFALAVSGVMLAATTSAFAAPILTPEPLTSAVFGAGLVGVALLSRRKKK